MHALQDFRIMMEIVGLAGFPNISPHIDNVMISTTLFVVFCVIQTIWEGPKLDA